MTPEAQGAVERAAEVAWVETELRELQSFVLVETGHMPTVEMVAKVRSRVRNLLATPPTASHDETALHFLHPIDETPYPGCPGCAARAAAGDADLAGESGGSDG